MRQQTEIYQAIVGSNEGDKTIKPLLKPYDTIGSTRYVEFDTTRPVYSTRPDKCHISHVVADTASWEQKMASALEEMDEVASYVKNKNLGFSIPYILNGEEKNYYPDFIAKIKNPLPPWERNKVRGFITPAPSTPRGEGGGEGEIRGRGRGRDSQSDHRSHGRAQERQSSKGINREYALDTSY